MRRGLLMTAVTMAALIGGCGGDSAGPMGLRFGAGAQGLDARTERVDTHLFAGERSCSVIEFSGPTVRGAYYERFMVNAGADGPSSHDLEALRPGLYTLAVWTFDAEGAALQFGCSEAPVDILNGRRVDVELALQPYSEG